MSVAPADQASDLRLRIAQLASLYDGTRAHAAPASARRARVIAIASGKGGVGKTNLAVNLAVRLAAGGRQVVLVDADLGTANVDVLLNLDAPLNLSHVLRGERRIEDIVLKLEAGLSLIPGAS